MSLCTGQISRVKILTCCAYNDYVDIKVDDQTFHISVTFYKVLAECLLDSSEWLSAMPNDAARIM